MGGQDADRVLDQMEANDNARVRAALPPNDGQAVVMGDHVNDLMGDSNGGKKGKKGKKNSKNCAIF